MEHFEKHTLRRFVFTPAGEQPLPLQVESVGINPDQEPIHRPHGYPLYHWIQTLEGKGTLLLNEQEYPLGENCGMLLFPQDKHAYQAEGGIWRTLYLTFGGPSASGIVGAFGIRESSFFSWEPGAGFAGQLYALLGRLEAEEDTFGLEASSDTYRFIARLSKFGSLHQNKDIARNLEKLQPLLKWMDEHVATPDVGLADFGAVLGVSGRYISSLFQLTFGVSPYAYFLQVRLRKAKELLVGMPASTVGEIAGAAGFREPSHFIATFRRATGMTPEQFRRLH